VVTDPAPVVGRGVAPDDGPVTGVTARGTGAGRFATTAAGLGLAWAAAAAAANPPVGLWQSMQSEAGVLPWWLPIVAVLMLAPNHFVPPGAWQVTHFGVDEPLLGVPLPLVQVMNGPLVCGTVVPLKPPGTVTEVWQTLHAVDPNGRCCEDEAAPPLLPGGFSGMPPVQEVAVHPPCAVP
jgi:hypothetical protein